MTHARLVLLAAALIAAPAAGSAASCQTDRLGNTFCVGTGLRPAPRLPEPFDLSAEPAPFVFIPSWREDAFGIVRPQRPAGTKDRSFGESPRPEPRTRCSRDSFGDVRCR